MQSQNETYADVILPLALGATFTYSVPAELAQVVRVGMRVIVQFGKRKVYSAIIKQIHHKKPSAYQTKDIVALIDDFPIVNSLQLAFWDWIATYYMCSIGEVYKAAVPSGLKLESESRLIVNAHFNEIEYLSSTEELLYNIIKEQKSSTIEQITSLSNVKNALKVIQSLISKHAIFVTEVVNEKYTPKTQTFIDAGGDISDADFVNGVYESLSRAKKQQELFMQYLQLCYKNKQKSEQELISRKALLTIPGASIHALNGLLEKGFLVEVEKEIGRLETGSFNTRSLKELNPFQHEAFEAIHNAHKDKEVVLLHGVTASGKTEIYIHLIAETIAQGKQVLYLLPEIALTAQIINRLKSVFGNQVGIYHSKFNDSERVEVWNNILHSSHNESFKVILGVRSSVFLPFSQLGLIIVDEEHETSYKQFDPSPRYNGRDAAIMLAKMHNAKVVMGTATPAIETYYNAKTGKYSLVELFQRHSQVELPDITIVDIKDETRKKRMHSHFSKTLLEKMSLALAQKEQIILFQNRRGFSPYIECQICGNIPTCVYCDVSLTFHRFSNNLVCHYCGYTVPNNAQCNACGSPNMTTRGFGTEKIEDEISTHFPDKTVARMDLDTTRAKHAYSEIIERFEAKEIDILVGTQMVTKGLDFENVSLVGILNADNMLNLPDFRAFERSYQLMTQVAGRAGRNTKRGEVVIQTSNPQHKIIHDVQTGNFNHMLDTQLSERHLYGYPPFTRLIKLTVKHRDTNILDKAAAFLADTIKKEFKNGVLGPEYPPISKIQNLYLKNILLKIIPNQNLASTKQFIFSCISKLKTTDEYKSVDVVINVDPY